MAKKKFAVTCTMIYNGYVEVEADNEEEALNYVQENLHNDTSLNPNVKDDFPDDGVFGIVDFGFGEATADYANEINY